MKRGDLVTIAVAGGYGKPRPALIVQADAFRGLGAVTVLRLTSELNEWPLFRVTMQPSAENGLRMPSQVMIDRAVSLPREKLGAVFGRLDDDTMRIVSRALAAFLGLEAGDRGER
jgi:mRNA interferase MazF